MRIELNTNLNFKRRLRPEEEAEFSAVLKQGKEKVGNTGHSMLIVPSASLPQELNTGMGHFLDKKSLEFVDFAKQYWGINYIQLLPEGNLKISKGMHFLPYSGSSLDLGTHLINLELLTGKDYGELLSRTDVENVVNANNTAETRVNFENVLHTSSPTDKALRKAYDELLKADTPAKKQILEQVKIYSETNREWLEPKSIYEALSKKNNTPLIKKWNNFDQNLYNIDVISIAEREKYIKDILESELGNEARFYNFKQYLAESHFAKAKSELNKKGIKLSGDMLIGFSRDEKWANPKAFHGNCSIGWGLPALDFNSAEGEKLFRQKVQNFAKRYDGIRADASWIYVRQPIKDQVNKTKTYQEHNDRILKIIEEEVRKIKGPHFSLENIMHEFIAGPEDFSIFDGSTVKSICKDRVKIYPSSNMSFDWETVSAFKKRGWKDGSYVLGATNHDSRPIRAEFENAAKRATQIEALSNALNIPKEKLNNLQGFIQAKFAEPIRSKHNMFFFTDALNILDKYKDNPNRADDYRIKIPKNYQENYFKALEKGEGFNIMDALEKAFVAEGLDKKEPELYKKIVKYKKILKAPQKSNKKKIFIALLLVKLALTAGYLVYRKNKKKAGVPGSNAQN